MSNFGIITFYRDNYGAFLQAYALQKNIEKIGNKVEIIAFDYSYEKCILGIPISYLRTNTIYFFKRIFVELLRYNSHKKRKSLYDHIVQQALNTSRKQYHKYDDLCSDKLSYDVLISGSDQVFNPKLHSNSFKTRLLTFSGETKVKASYAASFGDISNIGQHENELLLALENFDFISIREPESALYLQKKINREINCHCDPTLLLSSEEWLDFSLRNNSNNKEEESNYVLLYLLKYDENILQKVRELVNLGYRVISIGNRCRIKGVENPIVVPVDKFLRYIYNANRVITNSFHGTIFSIIFHKKHVDVFLPQNGGSRITNLLNNCGLTCYLKYGEKANNNDFIKSDEYIKMECEKAISYLEQLSKYANER